MNQQQVVFSLLALLAIFGSSWARAAPSGGGNVVSIPPVTSGPGGVSLPTGSFAGSPYVIVPTGAIVPWSTFSPGGGSIYGITGSGSSSSPGVGTGGNSGIGGSGSSFAPLGGLVGGIVGENGLATNLQVAGNNIPNGGSSSNSGGVLRGLAGL